MLENLSSKLKKLTVKYLRAYKIRVNDYIRIEKCGSSNDNDQVMFSADSHGNVNVNNILTTNSLVTNTLYTLSEQFYAPSSYIAKSETNTIDPIIITLTTNDLLKNKHIIVNVQENMNVNLTLPTAASLLSTATIILGRKPLISTLTIKGDWFIFTITNNSQLSYCSTTDVTLKPPATNGISPNGTITITGSANGLDSLCSGAARFGLYFTNVSSGSVAAVTILRLSGSGAQ